MFYFVIRKDDWGHYLCMVTRTLIPEVLPSQIRHPTRSAALGALTEAGFLDSLVDEFGDKPAQSVV